MKLLWLFKFITGIVCSAFLASCDSPKHPEIIYLSGSIRVPLVEELKAKNKPSAVIVLSSKGGLPSQAMLIVKSLQENNNVLIIQGECFSACAEYLLPVAKSVEFRDNPMIGFHWNAMMTEYLMRKNATKGTEHCQFLDSNELYRLQEEAGVNNEFWKETLERLGKNTFILDYKYSSCPWHKKIFENRMWLPTSEQLRWFYRLEFTGSVCADDYERCKRKIDRRWKIGTRIMVGDTLYVSKGRRK